MPLSLETKKYGRVVLSILILCHCRADTQITAASATQDLQVASPLVIVPTVVRSDTGNFVPGLVSRDFLLLDDGVEQRPVAVEQLADKPLVVVLVMQTGATVRHEFQRYQTVTKLLQITENVPIRKVGFVTFDSKPRQVLNFPERFDGVHYAMDNPEVGDSGAAVFDALGKASDLLEEQPATMRRLIILLSQPQDEGSKSSAASLLQRMGRTSAPIFSISFQPASTSDLKRGEKACVKESGLELPLTAASVPGFARVRQRLCHDAAAEMVSASGGEHLRIRNQQDLDQGILRLKDTVSNAYSLSFRPTSPASGFHLLSLLAGKKAEHLAVASRNLYWIP